MWALRVLCILALVAAVVGTQSGTVPVYLRSKLYKPSHEEKGTLAPPSHDKKSDHEVASMPVYDQEAYKRKYNFEFDTNRPGSDYASYEEAVPDACEARCKADVRCRAWTFVKPGVQGPKARCFLKQAQPKATFDQSCCVSGVKRDDDGTVDVATWGLATCKQLFKSGLYETSCHDDAMVASVRAAYPEGEGSDAQIKQQCFASTNRVLHVCKRALCDLSDAKRDALCDERFTKAEDVQTCKTVDCERTEFLDVRRPDAPAFDAQQVDVARARSEIQCPVDKGDNALVRALPQNEILIAKHMCQQLYIPLKLDPGMCYGFSLCH